ncbi:MAG: inorganic diphosphatase [Alphaproteobacteria bacterium]|nr:MAG: inorganic diphosphatase [Alphaproteobacteria bacterium]
MDISKISVGEDAPNNIHVIIENTAGGVPVKYEIDKESGALFVDRFVHTPMFYPANYGFVPQTLGGDGDPVDVLVYAQHAILPGAVICARPVGVLVMEDDGGQDEKILAVPVDKTHPMFADVKEYSDLPKILLDEIEHFFTHYKDLEKGKWVKIQGWEGSEKAKSLILEGIENEKASKKAA